MLSNGDANDVAGQADAPWAPQRAFYGVPLVVRAGDPERVVDPASIGLRIGRGIVPVLDDPEQVRCRAVRERSGIAGDSLDRAAHPSGDQMGKP
jgi:hypothetical protein